MFTLNAIYKVTITIFFFKFRINGEHTEAAGERPGGCDNELHRHPPFDDDLHHHDSPRPSQGTAGLNSTHTVIKYQLIKNNIEEQTLCEVRPSLF